MITQYIALNMVPGASHPVVRVSQYDTGARKLVFKLRNGVSVFTAGEGVTAIIHGIKPDSTYWSYVAEISGGTVTVDCTEQMTAVAGVSECEIRLSNAEGHIGSCNFEMFVEKSPATGAVISDSEIAAIETLTDRAEQAASSATSSATAAEESAEQAGESATDAGESADRAAREAEIASQVAEEAGESATAAAESASSASGSEASARGFAEQAEGFANEAENSAQGAAQDAQTASAKASEAAASATAASGSAVDSANAANLASGYADTAQAQAQAAGESATNAAGSASTAQTAAGTATTKAGEASDSATAANTSAGQAESSASAASASAGTASEKATQAGESATNAANSASAAAGSASDASDSAAAALASEQAAAQSASDIAASAAQIQINTDNIAALRIVESTSAADITSIDDGADGVPMQSLKVYIEPVQEGSGDPSPDNIRPISGWDSVETVRTGVNIWGGDLWYESGRWSSCNLDARTVSWTTYASTPYAAYGYNYKYKANTQYTLILTMKSTATHGRTGYVFRYTDGTSESLIDAGIGSEKKTFAFVSNGSKTLAYIGGETYSGTKTAWIDESGLLVGTHTADEFETYNPQTITTDLPSTVYGGVLDVVTGELTVDREMVDLGSLTWATASASANIFQANISDMVIPSVRNAPGIVSSIFKISSVTALNTSMDDYAMLRAIDLARLYVRDTDYTVASEFKAAITGQTLAYPLATPTTYTLTPEEVKTLLKQNNVFSNAGQTAIVYVADPKTYIDSAIADAVASLT